MPSKRSFSNKGSIRSLNQNQNKTIEPVENALTPSNPANEVKTEKYTLPPIYQFEVDTYQYRFQLFLIVFGLLVNFFILDWLIKVNNINKCQCANIDEGYLLKEWFMFLIAYQIFVALILIINGSLDILMPLSIIMSIISIITFVMIIRLLIYINKLRKINCDCGFNKQQNLIYYYWIIVYSILLFLILFALLVLIVSYINK
jgi:hypothetical protein